MTLIFLWNVKTFRNILSSNHPNRSEKDRTGSTIFGVSSCTCLPSEASSAAALGTSADAASRRRAALKKMLFDGALFAFSLDAARRTERYAAAHALVFAANAASCPRAHTLNSIVRIMPVTARHTSPRSSPRASNFATCLRSSLRNATHTTE